MSLKKLALMLIAGCLVASAGCRTPATNDSTALSDQELRSLLSKTRDPRRYWITVYSSALGPVFSGSCRVHPEQMADLSFQKSDGRPNAPLIIVTSAHGNEFTALLDSSSKESWMELNAAEKFDFHILGPPVYQYMPAHIQDGIAGYAAVSDSLRFGPGYSQLHMENPVFHVLGAHGGLGPLARGIDRPRVPVVLGCNVLKAYQFVQFDFPRRSVLCSATIDYTPDQNLLIGTLRLKSLEGVFAVDGLIDGKPDVFILDTAGDYELAVKNAPEQPIRQVSMGGLVFRQVQAEDSERLGLGLAEFPRIGNRLMSRYKMTFVPRKMLVHFERPEEVAEKN